MEFNFYQIEAKKTIQEYNTNETSKVVIPYLGIIGEAGSIVSELKKKLRDGSTYTNFENKLKEELGDVLWYVAAIATQNNIDLEEVAKENLKKINDRFSDEQPLTYKNYDDGYPANETFPDEFEIEFRPYEEDGKKLVEIIDNRDGSRIGDPLTDNNYEDDGYRFHDIFHFGYVAYMGWSPVIRKLLKIKRKSNPQVDEFEDGARAQIIEELISLFIYNHSTKHQLLKYSKNMDTDFLDTVRQLVKNLEVKDFTSKQWETTILSSYKVFHELIENNGGRVLVSKKNKKITFLGKN